MDCRGLAEEEFYQIGIEQTGWGHIDSSGYRNKVEEKVIVGRSHGSVKSHGRNIMI